MLYSRIHDTAPTRKSRTLRKARYVYGDGDAKDRYVRCQYCGFICDTKRDVLQPTSGVSVSPSDITEGVMRCECESNIEIRCEDGSILMEESTSLSLIVEQYYDYDDAILMEEDTSLPLVLDEYSYTDFYYQYEPIETYTVTHNCPFCGGQYTL